MQRFALLTAAGVLYFLGQVGVDIWPLNLIAFLPALWALDERHQPAWSPKRRVLACLWMGLVTMAGGYYWLVPTLEIFSGFPWLLCVTLSVFLWVYQGGSLALILWLSARGLARGYSAALVLPAAVCGSELVYPQLLGWYLGNALHEVPVAIQIADLGGPIAVSALIAVTNGALYEALRSARKRAALPRTSLTVAAAGWVFTLAYGTYRIHEVDARAKSAETLNVGMVQTNMGVFSKRSDIELSLARHIEQSQRLELKHDLDLLLWPESAFGYFLPADIKNVQRMVLGPVHTPTLFGALSRRRAAGRSQYFNTAILADAEGNVLGTYDKTYLLAFGEYLPFGETFPWLYHYSPFSGRLTPGSHMRALTLGDTRIAVLICYEDILPGFVRQSVASSNPHLLVNLTNDAWFGDTAEPWQHLALAKFRAVEHHRALLRSTNSGVTAAVDPVGRVTTHSGVMKRASLTARVPLMEGQTVYRYVGDVPGWLGLFGILWLCFGPLPAGMREPETKETAAA